MLHIALLGATGSIGTSTLDVIAHHPDEMTVVALAAGGNVELLERLARRFRPEAVCIGDPAKAGVLRDNLGPEVAVLTGDDGLQACACWPTADTVVNAVMGARGLAPTYAAALAGKRVCLANKEALVAGGELVMAAVRRHGAVLLPIDSEHSAIFQCLAGSAAPATRLYLTASGGPFRTMPAADLETVTPEAALRHPTWNMGGKITIDSATLMNKGLEVIEAHWLFGMDWEQIQVVVHPQSVIHSLVEFVDGAILAQLGAADMRLPIQVALLHPRRLPSPARRLDLLELGSLSFTAPDTRRFPCLDLAYAAGRAGGTMPAVMNAANEVAVQQFLERKLSFPAIPKLVAACMDACAVTDATDIHAVLAADGEARETARRLAAGMQHVVATCGRGVNP